MLGIGVCRQLLRVALNDKLLTKKKKKKKVILLTKASPNSNHVFTVTFYFKFASEFATGPTDSDICSKKSHFRFKFAHFMNDGTSCICIQLWLEVCI